ncbi:MAG: T9SS type A sorting domain-containing protein [Bacteroidota bacterium]
MKRAFALLAFCLLTMQIVSAQTIIRDTVINFSALAAYEAAHPELIKPCPTCPRKEAEEEGMNTFTLGPQPFPAGASIKMSEPLPGKPMSDLDATMAASRAPIQNWLGVVDASGSIPPDTYGAVGINHVVTATNNYIKIHAKIGGAQISQVTISAFTGVATTCDPQMFFDPSAQRWIFVAIGCAGVNNPVILMTSNTSDPTGAWRTITFIPLAGGLLDHPYLGYDDSKIVIGGRKFASGTTYTGPDIYLIDKSAMYTGTAITFGTNAQSIVMGTGEGDCPRPVTVYFPPYSTIGNPSPGTVYIVQSWNNTSLRLTTVTGNIPTAVWNTGSAVFPTAPTAEAWTSGNMGSPGSIPQMPPETRRLAANDARVSSAVMMNGNIWCSQHCAFPAGASLTNVTYTDVQYWKLNGQAGSLGAVLQRGRTGAVVGQHRWFSSIAVNKNEDVLIGYSMSDNSTMYPTAGYSTRQTSTPLNTLEDPLIFHTGESRYWKDYGSGRARWGDYSQTCLDPVDNSLWTTQEYASTYVGFPGAFSDNNSRFGTWWAQVAVSNPLPVISSGTATLATEGCVLNNGVIDPGETVTVSFCALNSGTGNTVNLVGTIEASGGIAPISGPQNYGVVTIGGPAVCRSFTFANTSSSCGGTITVSIHWQDGATSLGTTNWTFPLGTTAVISSQNFDGVVAPALPLGWSVSNTVGAAPFWVTSNAGTPTPVAVSLPNSIFVDDPAIATDKQIMTPSFIPGAAARCTFANNYNLENTFDGGVLEISINGGAYQDIVAAGGSFVSGGYTGIISALFGNPLASRNAWTGASTAFVTTTVNLPPASAGLPCVLKFRMASDNSVGLSGWRVDDFSISQAYCCVTPVPANTVVQNSTIPNGTNKCYNASQTITIAGSGTTFVVENGGSATFIAGQKINFLPGTTVAMGGYLDAYITLTSNYCYAPVVPVIPDEPLAEKENQLTGLKEPASLLFTVYPNPTTGKFTLEFYGDNAGARSLVRIYNIMGTEVLRQQLTGAGKSEFSLENQAPGIYMVSLMSGRNMETVKIIRK